MGEGSSHFPLRSVASAQTTFAWKASALFAAAAANMLAPSVVLLALLPVLLHAADPIAKWPASFFANFTETISDTYNSSGTFTMHVWWCLLLTVLCVCLLLLQSWCLLLAVMFFVCGGVGVGRLFRFGSDLQRRQGSTSYLQVRWRPQQMRACP
jgi:hypothetical protein